MSEYDALLIIDMQLVAFDGKITPPIQDGDQVLARCAELIDGCRTAGLNVIYIQTRAASGQPYAEDTHGWEIHPLVTPKPSDTIVYKVMSNGFEDTRLTSVLQNIDAKGLVTCGIWSEYCLARTSATAIEQGYQVLVASDAHGTVADNLQDAQETVNKQNKILKKRGAAVLTVREILDKFHDARKLPCPAS